MFFHGSQHKISKFTDEFVGGKEAHDQQGPGIYFTSSWKNARSYGPYVYTVKLKPRKAVSTQDGKNAPIKEIEWLLKQAPNWEMHAENFNENPNIGVKIAAKNFIQYNENPHQQFLQVWIDFYKNNPVDYVRNMVKLGYDIIYITGLESMISGEENITHAVVLNPSIIEFVEMEDDRNDEEKAKDSLSEIRKFIRNTISESLISEVKMNKTLYHGTPYDFKEFKNRTTFFSDVPQFAIDYASTKAQDAALDNDIMLVTVEALGDIFDPHNSKDFARLAERMPDTVEVPHGTWAMFTAPYSKDEMLKRVRGIATEKPLEVMVNAKVGEEITDPSYHLDKLMVVGKDSDYTYTIPKKKFQDYIKSSAMGYDEHFSHYTQYKDYFEPWRRAIVDLYNEKMGSKYEYPKSTFKKFYDTYDYTLKGHSYDLVNPYRRDDKVFTVTPEEQKRIDGMYEQIKNKVAELIKKDFKKTEWAIRPIEHPIDNTWTYLENNTVFNIIKDMGYDGYVAKEDGHNTYAIFDPTKSVKIISIKQARR